MQSKPSGPRIRRKHTIQAVRPENPEKNIQSKPSDPRIRRKTYNPNRPARKSEKKPTIQPVLLGCWLVVGCCVVDNPRRGPLWGQLTLAILLQTFIFKINSRQDCRRCARLACRSRRRAAALAAWPLAPERRRRLRSA